MTSKQYVVVYLPKKTIDKANLILCGGTPFRIGETWVVTTVRFSDGYEADVKVCGGAPPWVEVILFDETGHEVSFVEGGRQSEQFDKIEGKVEFYNHILEIRPEWKVPPLEDTMNKSYHDENDYWHIPVYYQSWGIVEVLKEKYPTLDAACRATRDEDFPLPSDPSYVEDSIVLDDEAVGLYNVQVPEGGENE